MSSYRQILYHIIFHTKKNKNNLPLSNLDTLFAYIMGIIKNKNCFLYRINGMPNHIHILSDLHPSIALADYIRDIKVASSIWIKQNRSQGYELFEGWASGYAAFTHSYKEKETIINYIKNQQIHHKKVSYQEELRNLLKSEGIEFDERYFLS